MKKNDKYSMFRNYLYNELDISKEDIKQWVSEAVFEVAERYIENEFANRPLDRRIRDIINGSGPMSGFNANNYGSSTKSLVAQELAKQFEVRIKDDSGYTIGIAGNDSSICNHDYVETDCDSRGRKIKCMKCGAIEWQKTST